MEPSSSSNLSAETKKVRDRVQTIVSDEPTFNLLDEPFQPIDQVLSFFFPNYAIFSFLDPIHPVLYNAVRNYWHAKTPIEAKGAIRSGRRPSALPRTCHCRSLSSKPWRNEGNVLISRTNCYYCGFT